MIALALLTPCALRPVRNSARASACCSVDIFLSGKPCRSIGTKFQFSRSASVSV